MGFFSKLFSRKQAQTQEPVKSPSTKTEELEKPEQPTVSPRTKTVSHKVAGTSYRQDAIQSLGLKNDEYELNKRGLVEEYPEGGTVYEYIFDPLRAELVPEPENPHDPKAIKVIVDGQHIGYIKAGSCAHIHRLLRENRIQKIEPRVIGGKYKRLDPLDEYPESTKDYELEKGSTSFGVRLEITELLAE